jgi:c-di-GMP-binding flagellar brake protein YcgR
MAKPSAQTKITGPSFKVDDESLFSLVKDMGKFRNILKKHVEKSEQALLRNSNGDQFFSEIFAISANNNLECTPPLDKSGTPMNSFINKTILVDIFADDERFHFESISSVFTTNSKKSILSLPISKQVFQRQRRTQFRYVIPKNYHADFSLKDGVGKLYRGTVLDISNMGVSVLWSKPIPKLKHQDLIIGSLKLGLEKAFYIKGVVCFLKKNDEDSLRIGLEFTEVDAASLGKLSDQIIDLHTYVFES